MGQAPFPNMSEGLSLSSWSSMVSSSRFPADHELRQYPVHVASCEYGYSNLSAIEKATAQDRLRTDATGQRQVVHRSVVNCRFQGCFVRTHIDALWATHDLTNRQRDVACNGHRRDAL